MNNAPFYIGQKVVCIKDTVCGSTIGAIRIRIAKGTKPLTVRLCEGKCVFFDEIVNPKGQHGFIGFEKEPAYHVANFAPIQYSDITSELASQSTVEETSDMPARVKAESN